MPPRIRVGLIGYGLAGATFHAPLIAAAPELTLAAVVTSRAQAVRNDWPEAAVVADPEALFTDPAIDLVVIATPNITHAPLAERALRAGKHVVVDKPFTLRSAEADALASLAAAQGRVLTVFHNRRYDGDFLTLKQLLADGELGHLSFFASAWNRFRPDVKDRWKERDSEGGGTLYDLGSHLLDQALQLFGPPETLFADLAAQRKGSDVIDYVHLVLTYGALRVILHADSLAADPGPRFVVRGDQKSFTKPGFDPQEDMLKAGVRPGDPAWGHEPEEHWGRLSDGRAIPTLPGCSERFYRELTGALRGHGDPPVRAHDAGLVIRLIEAALESQREARVVRFNPAG